MEIIKFGVGAFWFIPRNIEKRNSVTDETYIDLITTGIGKHSSINLLTLEVDWAKQFSKSVPQKSNWKKAIKDGDEYPLPDFFELTFELSVPLEWQITNIHPTHPWVTIKSPIQIRIKSEFHYTATFAKITSDALETSGSKAIYVARKYLEYIFQEDPHLIFSSIGPSPFHGDFELKRGEFPPRSANPFEFNRIPKRGYDTLTFEYNIEKFNDLDEAYDRLTWFGIGSEIGLFYFIKSRNIKITKKFRILKTNNEHLVKLVSASPIKKLLSMKSIDNHVQKCLLDIIEFEDEYESIIDYIAKELDQQKSKGITTHLDHFIQIAFEQLPNKDTKKYYSFCEFVEKRQSKKWEIGILAAAGLVGAMLGGIMQKS